jgi:hypothetical protein
MVGETGFPFLFWVFGGRLWGMGEALKAEAVVGKGREVVVKLATPDWPEGTRLTITAEPAPPAKKNLTMMDFFGTGKGLFATPEDADRFIREERDAADEGFDG